jgi:hypothetical protein
VLEGVYGKNWLNFFDAFCMWTFDCPPALIQREVGVDHKRLLQWEKVWHEGVEADLQTRLASSNIAAVPPQSANRTRGVKRGSRKEGCKATCRRSQIQCHEAKEDRQRCPLLRPVQACHRGGRVAPE